MPKATALDCNLVHRHTPLLARQVLGAAYDSSPEPFGEGPGQAGLSWPSTGTHERSRQGSTVERERKEWWCTWQQSMTRLVFFFFNLYYQKKKKGEIFSSGFGYNDIILWKVIDRILAYRYVL